MASVPRGSLRGTCGVQHDRVPGRHQARLPGDSSSCTSRAYLLRDRDCSLLPAIAASSFAGGRKEQRCQRFLEHIGAGGSPRD